MKPPTRNPKLKPYPHGPLPEPTVFRVSTGDGANSKAKPWPTFEDAERAARRSVRMTRNATNIYGYAGETGKPVCHMAEVIMDALDRVWCELTYSGGRVVDATERALWS